MLHYGSSYFPEGVSRKYNIYLACFAHSEDIRLFVYSWFSPVCHFPPLDAAGCLLLMIQYDTDTQLLPPMKAPEARSPSRPFPPSSFWIPGALAHDLSNVGSLPEHCPFLMPGRPCSAIAKALPSHTPSQTSLSILYSLSLYMPHLSISFLSCSSALRSPVT